MTTARPGPARSAYDAAVTVARTHYTPCGSPDPHGQHEWYDPALRQRCPGVSASPVPGEPRSLPASMLRRVDFDVRPERGCAFYEPYRPPADNPEPIPSAFRVCDGPHDVQVEAHVDRQRPARSIEKGARHG